MEWYGKRTMDNSGAISLQEKGKKEKRKEKIANSKFLLG